jgi:UDP-N-acetylglucosamine 2-epimerase (non-hydrolysing)
MTMPEEVNRIEIDALSDMLFCSEQSGMDHLEQEKIPGERHLVGNTMIDTLSRMKQMIDKMKLPFDEAGKKYAIVTLHRPSNVDDPETLGQIFYFLNRIAEHMPLVLPAHPRLKNLLGQSGTIIPSKDIFLISPLGYLEFIRQMQDAAFILTDSGGVQEEAAFLGKRCFTLRRNTERPSTIDSGSNMLIDPDNEDHRQTVIAFAANPSDPDVRVPELWDGKAGERIVKLFGA